LASRLDRWFLVLLWATKKSSSVATRAISAWTTTLETLETGTSAAKTICAAVKGPGAMGVERGRCAGESAGGRHQLRVHLEPEPTSRLLRSGLRGGFTLCVVGRGLA
jgi:hypothetical protein